jgi:PKHD-type hydroxylase
MRIILDALESHVALKLESRLQEQTNWISGSTTAGRFATKVKRNRQLNPSTSLYSLIKRKIISLLLRSREIQYATQPESIHTIIVSRYGPGEGYGLHMDAPFMGQFRSDISFTLSLSDPSVYHGGALVIRNQNHEDHYRLAPGKLILYPSTYLHYVEPIEQGERLAIVGWIQSRVKQSHRRELLYDLAKARDEIHKEIGETDAVKLLNRSYGNLLREWSG